VFYFTIKTQEFHVGCTDTRHSVPPPDTLYRHL